MAVFIKVKKNCPAEPTNEREQRDTCIIFVERGGGGGKRKDRTAEGGNEGTGVRGARMEPPLAPPKGGEQKYMAHPEGAKGAPP